jgi:hypothetical protein
MPHPNTRHIMVICLYALNIAASIGTRIEIKLKMLSAFGADFYSIEFGSRHHQIRWSIWSRSVCDTNFSITQ